MKTITQAFRTLLVFMLIFYCVGVYAQRKEVSYFNDSVEICPLADKELIDSCYNLLDRNMMLETKLENRRKRLLSKITLALRKLNDIELQVFDLTFYKCKDEDEIMDIISYGKDKVRYIKKSACIKFVSALGLDDRCFK